MKQENPLATVLMKALNDFMLAANYLMGISLCMRKPQLDELMIAHLLARDWIYWLQHPEAPHNPLHGTSSVGFLKSFENHFKIIQSELRANKWELLPYFEAIETDHCRLKEAGFIEPHRLQRAYRLTAMIFSQQGDESFTKLLDEKGIPAFDEAPDFIA